MWILPVITFAVTALLYTVALQFFPKLGLLDFPERYGLKRPRVPYPTGIVAIGVFLCLFLSLSPLSMQTIGVAAGVTLLGIVSFIDDRTPLPSSVRLIVQLLAAALIFASGSRIYTVTNPLGGILKLDTFIVHASPFGSLPVLSGVFTIGWLLLTINALNWFDGVPGQVSTVSLIGFLMLGLLSQFRSGDAAFALLAYSLAGIAAAGLLFDFPPAKMLLGDTGSMFFGLMLGLLGVYQGGKVATAFLALGIPLIDAGMVLLSRILSGKSPFQGGQDHLHHLLQKRGYSDRPIVLGTAVLGAVFGGTALFLTTAGKVLSALVLVVIMMMIRWWANTGNQGTNEKTKD